MRRKQTMAETKHKRQVVMDVDTYQKLLDEVENLLDIAGPMLYWPCDPEKNANCTKEGCQTLETAHPCRLTSCADYAVDGAFPWDMLTNCRRHTVETIRSILIGEVVYDNEEGQKWLRENYHCGSRLHRFCSRLKKRA